MELLYLEPLEWPPPVTAHSWPSCLHHVQQRWVPAAGQRAPAPAGVCAVRASLRQRLCWRDLGGGVLPFLGAPGPARTKDKASAQTSMEAVFQHQAPGLTQEGNNPLLDTEAGSWA